MALSSDEVRDAMILNAALRDLNEDETLMSDNDLGSDSVDEQPYDKYHDKITGEVLYRPRK